MSTPRFALLMLAVLVFALVMLAGCAAPEPVKVPTFPEDISLGCYHGNEAVFSPSLGQIAVFDRPCVRT